MRPVGPLLRKEKSGTVELIRYLRGNRDLLESYISEQLPMFPMSHVEATYLAWIDTRWLGARNTLSFFEKAGVGLRTVCV